ncbi:hypothetical protein KYB31_11940 [Clostridium felsineum]|uniref:hypothetical protein n=1 Tax=Clostridium felsineum TaxID=36839 RepID=UPI00098C065E|nr:hypothetical protein [Clostridium felsineum]MCR3759690.1 hypothetical protein [Clostridium felsineum]URZ02531.1 hypothetical protein CLAUR_025430 [Clostridium felsineum]
MKNIFKFISLAGLMFTLSSVSVNAANLANPNYEVKFMVDSSKILNSDGSLKSNAISDFDITSSKNLNVQYLDTDNLDLNKNGWIVRFRKFNDDTSTELTYKKRYSITNGDIKSALKTAANDGFDANEDNYSPQVDWGYSNESLSFSNNKYFSLDDYSGLELPNTSDSIDEAIENIPGKLNKFIYKGWAQNYLNSSTLHGPYLGTRYIGSFNGLKIELEIYNVRGTSISEISFKEDDYSNASQDRQALMNTLDSKGILIKSDDTKTGIMLGD